MILDELPRLIVVGLASWGLVLVMFRWTVTRVLTPERRFLLLALVAYFSNAITSGVIKTLNSTPADISTWISVLVAALFLAYVHYSLPPEFRRFLNRFTRSPHGNRRRRHR